MKYFITSVAIALLITLVNFNFLRREFTERMHNSEINKMIMEHCGKLGRSSNWTIYLATTTINSKNEVFEPDQEFQGYLYCAEKKEATYSVNVATSTVGEWNTLGVGKHWADSISWWNDPNNYFLLWNKQ